MLANDNMWNWKKNPIDVEYKFWPLKFEIIQKRGCWIQIQSIFKKTCPIVLHQIHTPTLF
jgi:hypothetical protein